jgi:hypothetical protein
VRGYYIDLRIKPETPVWPPRGLGSPETRLHVAAIQWGLGCFERYLAGDGQQWLDCARACADDLVTLQQPDGAWQHHQSFSHTFPLRPPWVSAMAQGEGASLLVRAHQETGEDRYADAARRALLPLERDGAHGGAHALIDGDRWFPEEYPTDPPSFVLNGAIFAMWGLYDVGVGLDDAPVRAAFEAAVDMLADNLHRWDLGFWSRYDLFPHPVPNIASSFYHDLHINQLRAMHLLSPRPRFAEVADRWARRTDEPLARRRAFAQKALFRILVPRSRLARHLPWSHLRAVPERRGA